MGFRSSSHRINLPRKPVLPVKRTDEALFSGGSQSIQHWKSVLISNSDPTEASLSQSQHAAKRLSSTTFPFRAMSRRSEKMILRGFFNMSSTDTSILRCSLSREERCIADKESPPNWLNNFSNNSSLLLLLSDSWDLASSFAWSFSLIFSNTMISKDLQSRY